MEVVSRFFQPPRQSWAELQPLQSFRKDYPECRTLLVYPGNEQLKAEGVLCVPANRFLSQLDPKRKSIAPA